MAAVAAGRLDEIPREEFEEGESFLLLELIANGTDFIAYGAGGRLSHGDLLGVVQRWSGIPPAYQTKGVAVFSSSATGQLNR